MLEGKSPIFINHTNHHSNTWKDEQRAAAEKYGKIIDIPFPIVNPHYDEVAIIQLADEKAATIIAANPTAVLCQGDFSYTYAMINRLKREGITVLAATSERQVKEKINSDGTIEKLSTFKFVKFREYRG